jgi:hypothetical protein
MSVGITLFTIEHDDGLDRTDLAAMASRPKWYYEAIYRTIAVSIPCPADRYWRGRRRD